MCVVSMVGDHYHDKWKDWNPFQNPQTQPTDLGSIVRNLNTSPSKAEFDALKNEVQEMKKLLERALEYDKKNNEPECHMDEKVATLKKIAELVGVDLSTIFK